MKHKTIRRATLALISNVMFLLATLPVPATAFYEFQAEEGSLDLRGLIRGFCTAYENPENNRFYEDKREAGAAGIVRLLTQARAGRNLGFEFNAYQTYIPTSLVSRQAGSGAPLDVERSAALEWSFSEDKYIHLAIDRLNIRLSHNRLDLILGRQPVNLATTFYFTPNDFFATFAAQSFYRVYKPGVDAVRAEWRLGDLSQLSLISVLGYKRDSDSSTGWSDGPEGDRASHVGRVSAVFRDFEWALLGGIVREATIIGGSLQGELFQWLGVRAEGHLADPDDSKQDSYAELSLGVEHHYENSLDLRLEQFYHGSGAGDISGYSATPTATQARSVYLGRNYTAFGVGYEFTPLLNAEMLAIANWTDHSYLLSFNAIYSISDESELAVNLGMPIGKDPEGAEIKSEFGLYPYSVNIEIRTYF